MNEKYTVYRLFDQRSPKLIYYVGVTLNLKVRIAQHRACDGTNLKKDDFVRTAGCNLASSVIDVLEDREEAYICEAYWIGRFKQMGMPLTNKVIPALVPKKNGECVDLRVALPKESPLLAYLRQRRQSTGQHESQVLLDMAQNYFEMMTKGPRV